MYESGKEQREDGTQCVNNVFQGGFVSRDIETAMAIPEYSSVSGNAFNRAVCNFITALNER